MNDTLRISGIHHITAVTSSASENLAFYENTLGLRLVKQTVNFDDPYTYHLYYGDAEGLPGTILTFFPWERLPQGRPGAGMLTAIAFAVPREAADFWVQRISAAGIATRREERFGETVLGFTDPHGLPLELIGCDRIPEQIPWTAAIPAHCAIRGFHSTTATLNDLPANEKLLAEVMGLTLQERHGNRRRYAMADPDAPGRFLDLLIDPQAPAGRPGGGTVHHVAFRTQDDASQKVWQRRLRKAGFEVTPVIDRNYFKSVYFRMPGGVLFEIATDPPGFTQDETLKELGRTLMLPARLEPLRKEIQAHLPWLRANPAVHRFEAPAARSDSGRTLVTLHGMGGSEHDLISFAGRVAPDNAILSPRGEVLEEGKARFFRRFAPDHFDEADILYRAQRLADFLIESTARYGRNPARLAALGYSNGANMAAAILLLRPETFAAAVLLRPMLPLQKPQLPNLNGKPVLILRGRSDEMIPAESTHQLARVLRQAGAQITAIEIAAGHELTRHDIDTAKEWLACVARPQARCRMAENEMLV